MKKVFLSFFLLVFMACQKGDVRQTEPSASPEIAQQLATKLDLDSKIISTPASILSVASNLEIGFSEPMVSSHMSGQVLDPNPFSFNPEIQGVAKWISPRILQFIPDDALPAGKTIKGTLSGKKLFGKQQNVNDFQFSFKVAEQEVMSIDGDFEVVKEGQSQVRFVGTLRFAQDIVLTKIEKDLSCKGPGGKIRLNIEASSDPREVVLKSEALDRTAKGQSFKITLPGKYTVSEKKWEKVFYLAGIDIFRVLGHMDMSDPESSTRAYGFRFSDPIQKASDISGYVSITPEIEYKVRTQGKYLIVEGNFIAGQSYLIRINAGLGSTYGTKLSDTYVQKFAMDNLKPEIRWLSEGVYLPSVNDYKLQFKSVNVARVYLSVYEIYPQNIGFFLQTNSLSSKNRNAEDGYYYRDSDFSDLDRVGKRIYHKKHALGNQKNQWIKTEADLDSIFTGKTNSVYIVRLQFNRDDLAGKCTNNRNEIDDDHLYYEDENYYSNPCEYGYYYQNGTKEKLLIASNIGLTAKKTESALHIYATHVISAKPVGGLELQLFTYYNTLVESKPTDNDGHVVFKDDGAYIFGQSRDGIALMKLNEHFWEMNHFKVSGAEGSKQGVDVFMYADRGVHRPGDTVHLSAIIRMERQAPPENQPVLLKVKNPQGQEVFNSKTECGFNGHIYFEIPTDVNDPTGNWHAEMQIGEQKFYKTLKIETVKPNRLKIQVDLPECIEYPNQNLSATITAKYLFGAPAAGLKALVRMNVDSKPFYPQKYRDYTFQAPLVQYQYRTNNVFDGFLDQSGICKINTTIPGIDHAPGPLRVELYTKVDEKGGSFVDRQDQTTVYPYDAYVGVKNTLHWNSAVVGEEHPVPVVVLNREGKPVPGHELRVRVYLNRRYWWYHYDRRDRRDFREMESTYVLSEAVLYSEEKPVEYQLKVEDYGRHYIEIQDLTSGHETGFFFYGSSWGRPPEGLEAERNTLEISTDQNTYQPGDMASLYIDTPDKGIILFTLEQGDRILHQSWEPVKGEKTEIAFKVTEDMLPNCYAVLSLIQPHNQNTNDLPMRIYGIKPIYVEKQDTRLPLVFSMPDEIRPMQEFQMKITSKSKRKASFTLAVVDEGLLDLTQFKTPNPWDHFFQKLRLGVQTLDNFDEIIGVLFPDMDKYISIGGGLDEEAREKRLGTSKVRRFIPVVLFQKPMSIQPGRTETIKFTMPNYVGAVRAMLVGCADNSYASLEKTVPVKQPVMILPTVPRVARPGDQFTVPVSVFAMDSAVGKVYLTIAVSDNLVVSGPDTASMAFDKPGEKDMAFRVKVGPSIGAGKVEIQAKAGKEKAEDTVDLPLNSPNPFYTDVTDTLVNKGEALKLIPVKIGIDGTNHARLAFSRMPDIQLDKRVNHLIRYPYGCIEQTTSAVFPQLFLPYLLDLKDHQKQRITENINEAMQNFYQFKLSSGFGYWPYSTWFVSHYSEWGTNYIGHFLIIARQLGYHVPDNLYNHWLNDAKKRAKQVNRDDHRYQTYRLFLLALTGEPDLGAMNFLRENYSADLDPVSRKLLSTAYALIKQKNVATELDRQVPTEMTPYRELAGTYGSALRDRALLAYLCVLSEDLKTGSRLIQSVAREYKPYGWYSTQETAMTILAMGTFYQKSPFTGGGVEFTWQKQGEKPEKVTLTDYQQIEEIDDMWNKSIIIKSDHENPLFVTLFREGVPLEDRVQTEHQGIQLTRNFYDEEGNAITVDSRPSGQAFWVIYTVQSLYAEKLENLALTSIFPTGWEIINTRMTNETPPRWVQNKSLSSGDYMDIRDDRINWFFDLQSRRQIVLGTKINPSFKGDYVLPPVSVEAMYSPEYYARIQGGRVTVE